MTPQEEAELRQLGQILDRIAGWEALVKSLAGGWQVSAGSELAQDNIVSPTYQVGAGAWSAILAAISHLGCLRDSLFHHNGPDNVTLRLHTHGPFTLIRGGLENASLAMWLLEPDVSTDRILRRVQQEWNEVRQLENVRAIVNSPSTTSIDQRAIQLRNFLTSIGAPANQLKQQPGYESIVTTMGATMPHEGKAAQFIWKACSALAHGESRGMAAYLTKASLGQPEPGVTLTKMTNNTELMVAGGMIAMATTVRALEIYKGRANATMTI